MFLQSKPLLERARAQGYAIPAFNTSNLEITLALFQAAERMRSPLLIQTTESTIKYAGLENIFSIIKTAEEQASIPVCIHLDHGKGFQIAKQCIDLGYKSVMIDASSYSFSENIKLTKKGVGYARSKKCSVEAELGTLGRLGEANLTDPKQAADFARKSHCDALAVAIGTSHGAYKFKGKPRIDLGRLKEIAEAVEIPLVLHGASTVRKECVKKANRYGARISGASGVKENALAKAIRLGVSKINIDTDLRLAFTASLREFLFKNPENFDPRASLGYAGNAVRAEAERKIRLFGCRNKAFKK